MFFGEDGQTAKWPAVLIKKIVPQKGWEYGEKCSE
jgi:hypothetical protein